MCNIYSNTETAMLNRHFLESRLSCIQHFLWFDYIAALKRTFSNFSFQLAGSPVVFALTQTSEARRQDRLFIKSQRLDLGQPVLKHFIFLSVRSKSFCMALMECFRWSCTAYAKPFACRFSALAHPFIFFAFCSIPAKPRTLDYAHLQWN